MFTKALLVKIKPTKNILACIFGLLTNPNYEGMHKASKFRLEKKFSPTKTLIVFSLNVQTNYNLVLSSNFIE